MYNNKGISADYNVAVYTFFLFFVYNPFFILISLNLFYGHNCLWTSLTLALPMVSHYLTDQQVAATGASILQWGGEEENMDVHNAGFKILIKYF